MQEEEAAMTKSPNIFGLQRGGEWYGEVGFWKLGL